MSKISSATTLEDDIIAAIEYLTEDDGPTIPELRTAYLKVKEYCDTQLSELDTLTDLGSRQTVTTPVSQAENNYVRQNSGSYSRVV